MNRPTRGPARGKLRAALEVRRQGRGGFAAIGGAVLMGDQGACAPRSAGRLD
jgi:hypothetical protein